MKRKIKIAILNTIYFLIYICCIFKFYKTIAFLIKISLRQIKTIKQNKKGKVFFILHKSNGTEEIINAYKNKTSKYLFYEMKRSTLKTICNFFLKGLADYNYKSFLREHDSRKMEYKKVLEIIFNELKKTTKLYGIINFNIFYKSDFELAKVCKMLDIKFITFHKEGIHTPNQSINAKKIYSFLNDKYSGDKIAVSNFDEKKRMVSSGIFYKNKITVVGSPRISYFYNLKPNKIEKKVKIVFFQYTKKRGNIINKNIKVRNIYDKPDISWNKTELSCVKVLIELCKKYPNTLEVIFKIRENVYNAPNFLGSLKLPINFNISSSPTAYKYIENSNIVLSYNSSTLIEGIAAKKLVILPFFDGPIDWRRCLNVKGAAKIILTRTKLKKYIESFINEHSKFNKIYSFKSTIRSRKKIIDKYFFNSDDKASKRMINFLEKLN
jgi:hypothetical protein